MKIYLPLDSAAVALGADEIAHAIEKHAHAKGVAVTLVRNGSRGMVWLEPMVEVEGPKGRLAFGPMTLADVPAMAEGANALDLCPCRRDRPAEP
jgi:formate dehydrogenase iron-sulfur subunit